MKVASPQRETTISWLRIKYPLPDPGSVGSNCTFGKAQRFLAGALPEQIHELSAH